MKLLFIFLNEGLCLKKCNTSILKIIISIKDCMKTEIIGKLLN